MATYVALLRGIGPTNPNMHPAKLKGAFEKMGFKNVRTVIASGNVVFESSSKKISTLEATIEKALPKLLGFSSTTVIRSQKELEMLVKKNPFKKHLRDSNLYPLVTFLKEKPAAKNPLPRTGSGFAVYDAKIRAICAAPRRDDIRTPNFMALSEKHFGKNITSRTWKTVLRILRKMEAQV